MVRKCESDEEKMNDLGERQRDVVRKCESDEEKMNDLGER